MNKILLIIEEKPYQGKKKNLSSVPSFPGIVLLLIFGTGYIAERPGRTCT